MNTESRKVVRVVAPPHDGGGAQHTMGTKVLMPDGSVMPGVTRVVLVGELDKPWVAHITCHVREVDITALDDTGRRFTHDAVEAATPPESPLPPCQTEADAGPYLDYLNSEVGRSAITPELITAINIRAAEHGPFVMIGGQVFMTAEAAAAIGVDADSASTSTRTIIDQSRLEHPMRSLACIADGRPVWEITKDSICLNVDAGPAPHRSDAV